MPTLPIATPALPATAAEAIRFALSYLESWEVAMFLQDWWEGRDMAVWLPPVDDDATHG